MSTNDHSKTNKPRQASKGPVVQQFAAGGAAVPTPEIPYDVEKARGHDAKPAPRPQGSKPEPPKPEH